MDVARLGISAETDGFVQADAELDRFQNTSKKVTSAVTLQNSAIKANNAALTINAKQNKLAQFQQRNLVFQLNDVFQSMALGIPIQQTLLQQGPQIAQIYGPGEGGIGRAFKETGKLMLLPIQRFPILTGLTVALGAAFLGLRKEINDSTKITVTYGDVFNGVINAITNALKSRLEPAFNAVGTTVEKVYNFIIDGTKTVGNAIIGAFVGAFELAVNTAKIAANGIVDAYSSVISFFGANKIPPPFPEAELRAAAEFFERDYLGEAFSAVKLESIKAAQKRIAELNDELKKTPEDPWEGLRKGSGAIKDRFGELREGVGAFIGDLRTGLKNGEGFFKSFSNAVSNALDRVISKLIDVALNAAFPTDANKGGFGDFLARLLGGSTLTRRATGGAIYRNQPTLVGERGPEIIMPRTAGEVLPNRKLGMMGGAAQASGQTFVTVNNYSGQEVRDTRRNEGDDEFIDIAIGDSILSGKQDGPLGTVGAKPTGWER